MVVLVDLDNVVVNTEVIAMTFSEWIESMKDVPIRYLVYKRFLPEGAHATDEEFTSCYYETAYIKKAIDTGHGWLVALESIDYDECEECWVTSGIITYYNLNEIRIEQFACDLHKPDEETEADDELEFK